MKKIFASVLALLMSLCLLSSCNISNNTDTSTAVNSGEGEKAEQTTDTKAKVQKIETKKYYKELKSSYTTVPDGIVYEEDQIFLDGVFEMKRESQYVALSSLDDLEAFTLLNRNDIEQDIFEDSYIVALLHYFEGPSIDGRYLVGFYDANFAQKSISVDKAWGYGEDASEDLRDVYRLYFIVVPKNEIEVTGEVLTINVNENRVEQYNMEAICIDTTPEKTTAYYFENRADMLEIGDFENVRVYYAPFPCILVHLDKKIETDYIANGFKYENGEIFITVQIFETTEMEYLHGIGANLLAVSLRSHVGDLEINVPDVDLTDCKINVVFEKVVSIN